MVGMGAVELIIIIVIIVVIVVVVLGRKNKKTNQDKEPKLIKRDASKEEELASLKSMLDSGIISASEYEQKRQEILNR